MNTNEVSNREYEGRRYAIYPGRLDDGQNPDLLYVWLLEGGKSAVVKQAETVTEARDFIEKSEVEKGTHPGPAYFIAEIVLTQYFYEQEIYRNIPVRMLEVYTQFFRKEWEKDEEARRRVEEE